MPTLEDESEDKLTWPPSPAIQRGDETSKNTKLATAISQKNIALGAIAGAGVNFVLNFFYMIVGDILWLDIERKLEPLHPPLRGYFGTGTPSFFWIILLLSLGNTLCFLAARHPLHLKVKIAYILGACLMFVLTISFWLSVENINML